MLKNPSLVGGEGRGRERERERKRKRKRKRKKECWGDRERVRSFGKCHDQTSTRAAGQTSHGSGFVLACIPDPHASCG